MTMMEAKKIYLKSDCSHFAMCVHNYSAYLQYKRLEPTKRQEEAWKNERIQILYTELQRNGKYEFFEKLYKIAVEFRDYEKLKLILESLNYIRKPMKPMEQIGVAEIILGIHLKRRTGLACWTWDIGQREDALLLIEQAGEYLNIPDIKDVTLEKRRQYGKWMYQKMCAEMQ